VTGQRLVLTHGCSLSNLPLFVAVGEGLFAAEGLEVEAPYFNDITSTAELLASGVADLGTAAFTQPLICDRASSW
jgi:NitT/TauT family transport system substrate-binding protein